MKKLFGIIFVMLFSAQWAIAAEDVGEKMDRKGRDARREVKKDYHRAEEQVKCPEGDAKCAKTKVENRSEEAKDYTKDKSKDTKNKID